MFWANKAEGEPQTKAEPPCPRLQLEIAKWWRCDIGEGSHTSISPLPGVLPPPLTQRSPTPLPRALRRDKTGGAHPPFLKKKVCCCLAGGAFRVSLFWKGHALAQHEGVGPYPQPYTLQYKENRGVFHAVCQADMRAPTLVHGTCHEKRKRANGSQQHTESWRPPPHTRTHTHKEGHSITASIEKWRRGRHGHVAAAKSLKLKEGAERLKHSFSRPPFFKQPPQPTSFRASLLRPTK